MTGDEELTPVEYDEVWEVKCGNEKFVLNEKQMAVIREADMQGNKGLLYFDKKVINPVYIQCAYVIERRPKITQDLLPEYRQQESLDPKIVHEKITEIKEKLKKKFTPPKPV